MKPLARADLDALRQRVAALETEAEWPAGRSHMPHMLPFGLPALDRPLGGGLTLGTLHEARGQGRGAAGALLAFALVLAARAARARRRPVLLVQQDLAALEAGQPHGPGLQELGLPEGALVLVRVRRPQDALLAMEEGLKCPGLSAVLGEVASPVPDTLTATRRLALAARAGQTIGLLLRPTPGEEPCASFTRWIIGPAPSTSEIHGGLGVPCLSVALRRNRLGPPGAWILALEEGGFRLAASLEADHERARERPPAPRPADGGTALSQPVAGTPVHRSRGTAAVA